MEPTAETKTATRTAALWIGAVFILGLALGVVAGYWYAHRPAPQLSDEARRHQKVVQLTNVLALTPDQQSQIEVIFSDTQSQFQAARKNADQQIEAGRQKGRDRIRAVLTPEQLPKFEDFLRKLDEDRKNRPPPGR
jgi:Spy/CpxP family protein refolding chaperone